MLFENDPNSLHKEIYTILYLAGGRVGELFNVEWEDIDFDNEVIYIKNITSHPTKTRKSRIIPMYQVVKSILL